MALFDYPAAYSLPFRLMGRRVLARSIATADRIIAITKTTADAITSRFPSVATRIEVIFNGVSEMFHDVSLNELDRVRLQLRDMLGLTFPFILFVGNVEPKKNLRRLVQAFKSIAANFPEHRLLIVGERPVDLPSDGTAEYIGDPRVRFTGYLSDDWLPSLYRTADCVAFPSLYEGFGMPIIEAMAAGTPVVTSNVSCLPEVAGGAAALVDPFDITDIARGLSLALSDRTWRSEAVARGLERASLFTWRENVRNTVSVYNSLL